MSNKGGDRGDEEIRNFFYILAGKNKDDSAPRKLVLYGLRNYGLEFDDKEQIIEKIQKNNKKEIDFKEFKGLFTSKIEDETDPGKFAQYILQEMKNTLNIEQGITNGIGAEELARLLNILEKKGLWKEEGKEEKTESNSKDSNLELAKKMLRAIDVNGNGKIDIDEIKFLTQEYLKDNK